MVEQFLQGDRTIMIAYHTIWHRVNTIAELEKIKNLDDGVEIDVRSIHGKALYLSHDISDSGELFENWLKHYTLRGTLVINIKEEGLEERIIKMLEDHGISNYMFLDEPFWFLLKSSRKFNNKNFAIRASKFESVDTALMSKQLSNWVWYDYFDDVVNVEDLKLLINSGFKVIMPSHELVGSKKSYEKILEKAGIILYGICKDRQ